MKTYSDGRSPVLLLCVLVAAIFLCAEVAIHNSYHPNVCVAYSSTDQTTQDKDVNESIWCLSTWAPITVFTFVLAVATVGLWIFTARLWRATERAVSDGEKAIAAAVRASEAANAHVAETARAATAMAKLADTAENTAVRQLRAYVSPSITRIIKFSLSEPIEIEIGFQNVGQTPARVFVTHSVIFLGAHVLDKDATMPEPKERSPRHPMTPTTLFPGIQAKTLCQADFVLTKEEIAGLLKRGGLIYISGEARYQDVFGHDRSSQFCFYINEDSTAGLIAREFQPDAAPIDVKFIPAHIWNKDT